MKRKRLFEVDGILNDWGIHHLHLQSKGTKHVLMCHVTRERLYAIGFWPHNSWTDTSIITALIDSWPEDFEKYRLVGVLPPSRHPNEQHVKHLRSKNLASAFNHPNGKVYMVGPMPTTAGISIAAVRCHDDMARRIVAIEKQIRAKLPQVTDPSTINLVLEFDGWEPVSLFDPKNGRRIRLRFDAALMTSD